METEHLLTAASTLVLVWATSATVGLWPGRRGSWLSALVPAAASYLSVGLVLWLDSMTTMGRNSAMHLVEVLLAGDPHHVCAAGLGLSIGVGMVCTPLGEPSSASHRAAFLKLIRWACLPAALLFLGLFAVQEQLQPHLVHRKLTRVLVNPIGSALPASFALEEFHSCNFKPVQIATGPDGSVYATGYRGLALQDGVLVKLSADAGGQISARTIARNLGRPHGLAVRGQDIYVSRSGQFSRARHGSLEHEATGAVTLLRDLDGDGKMDFFHDIVSELPGAQGPDPLHQNNGIVFDQSGSLYITVGSHSDRAPATAEFEGTILRSGPDGSNLEVFARGFRNPFDVATGPDGLLFCTDNDANSRRSGDELNCVVAGGHYGFPYAHGDDPDLPDAVSPIMVLRRGSLQGLVYADTPRLPSAYRDCFYAVSYGNGEIFRIQLQPQGDSYTAQPSLFARVPGAVDITIDHEGHFYVSCFEQQRIYRISLHRSGT